MEGKVVDDALRADLEETLARLLPETFIVLICEEILKIKRYGSLEPLRAFVAGAGLGTSLILGDVWQILGWMESGETFTPFVAHALLQACDLAEEQIISEVAPVNPDHPAAFAVRAVLAVVREDARDVIHKAEGGKGDPTPKDVEDFLDSLLGGE